MNSTPSDSELLAEAGWPVSYASVLHRVEVPGTIAAVIDANGDGIELDFEMWHLDDDGAWRSTYSCGAGLLGSGWLQDVAYLYGHSPGAPYVRVEFDGSIEVVPVGENGWWIFLTSAALDQPPPRLMGSQD